jgi:pimeloyl-ACP methyl ester carboxylesterase
MATTPVEHKDIQVSGSRTMHVTIFGPADGPPAVALHGLGGNTEQLLPALAAVAEHYGLRTYAVDLPNHGRSGKVRIHHFHVRHFADLIVEAVDALRIEPVVAIGYSFGGQLAAILAERLGKDSVQPIVINPTLGKLWDLKLRRCWRQPWRFIKLLEELGYNDGNVGRSELYHAGRLIRSVGDMFRDRHLRPFRRVQVTLALLSNCETAGVLGRLLERGIQPIVVQGALDQCTPVGAGAHLVDGFHDWLQEATGPELLLTALDKVFTGPASRLAVVMARNP